MGERPRLKPDPRHVGIVSLTLFWFILPVNFRPLLHIAAMYVLISQAFCKSQTLMCSYPGKRGKSPGKLSTVRACCDARHRNGGGFPPVRRRILYRAAPACPGFCPSYLIRIQFLGKL